MSSCHSGQLFSTELRSFKKTLSIVSICKCIHSRILEYTSENHNYQLLHFFWQPLLTTTSSGKNFTLHLQLQEKLKNQVSEEWVTILPGPAQCNLSAAALSRLTLCSQEGGWAVTGAGYLLTLCTRLPYLSCAVSLRHLSLPQTPSTTLHWLQCSNWCTWTVADYRSALHFFLLTKYLELFHFVLS